MKIVCLQLDPELEKVQRNIDHATEMVAKLTPDDVDILVLPEMAFSGYVFTSKDHIRPFLEDAETGPSISWAKQQAIRLKAHVSVGFPEKKTEDHFYNSVGFVSPEGKLLTTYAKTFLYYTDENWAEEGPGFQSIPVEGLGQVGFGICMDVNPYKFQAPFQAYEFSTFHLNQKSKLILCSMAWNKGEEAPAKKKLEETTGKKSGTKTKKVEADQTIDSENGTGKGQSSSGDGEDSDEWEDEEDEEDEERIETERLQLQYETVQYWAVRMRPYYEQAEEPFQEAHVVVANRIGYEKGALFVGSSCVLHLTKTGPELIGVLPTHKEGLLKVEI